MPIRASPPETRDGRQIKPADAVTKEWFYRARRIAEKLPLGRYHDLDIASEALALHENHPTGLPLVRAVAMAAEKFGLDISEEAVENVAKELGLINK